MCGAQNSFTSVVHCIVLHTVRGGPCSCARSRCQIVLTVHLACSFASSPVSSECSVDTAKSPIIFGWYLPPVAQLSVGADRSQRAMR